MKKIEILEIAIKLLGLYSMIGVIDQIKEFSIILTVWFQTKNNPLMEIGFDQKPGLYVTLSGILLSLFISGILILKSNKIAKLICIDIINKDQTKIEINKKDTFDIAISIIGLIFIINSIPDLFVKIKNYKNFEQINLPTNDNIILTTYILKFILGIVVIIFSRKISSFILRIQKD